jgi:Protein of unknown function (DUF2934)
MPPKKATTASAPKKTKTETGNGHTGATGNGATASTTSARTASPTTLEQIRRRAYEIYEASGRPQGRDREHWLQAEAEIRGQQSR